MQRCNARCCVVLRCATRRFASHRTGPRCRAGLRCAVLTSSWRSCDRHANEARPPGGNANDERPTSSARSAQPPPPPPPLQEGPSLLPPSAAQRPCREHTHTHTHTHENASRVCSTQAVHCAVQMCAVGLHSQRQGRLQAGPGTRLQRCQARVRLQLLQQVPLVCEAQRAQAAGAPPRPRRQLPPKQGGLREGVAGTGFVQGARASRQAGWAAGRCQSKTDHCENSMLRRAQTAAVRHR